MAKMYKKNLDDVILRFRINGVSLKDSDWVDVDILITSPVISYNLKDWECDGEILECIDMNDVDALMEKWMSGSMTSIEEYETVEPDLLLRFYPGEEKKIDFCVCLQSKKFVFSSNYIVLPLEGKDAVEFVEYWKKAKANLKN